MEPFNQEDSNAWQKENQTAIEKVIKTLTFQTPDNLPGGKRIVGGAKNLTGIESYKHMLF
jgi:hypothetical protein